MHISPFLNLFKFILISILLAATGSNENLAHSSIPLGLPFFFFFPFLGFGLFYSSFLKSRGQGQVRGDKGKGVRATFLWFVLIACCSASSKDVHFANLQEWQQSPCSIHASFILQGIQDDYLLIAATDKRRTMGEPGLGTFFLI